MADIKVVEINKVMISGRLTRDPELRYTPSGVAVTTLRMAINSSFVSKEKEKREEVCYIDVVAWRRQAETCVEYLRKVTLRSPGDPTLKLYAKAKVALGS